jgi:hypothetical protein
MNIKVKQKGRKKEKNKSVYSTLGYSFSFKEIMAAP